MNKNFNCSVSLTHFLPHHPLQGEIKSEDDCIYNTDFQSMIDGGGGGGGGGDGDDYGGEETVQFGDKKRRLSNHQVKSLEKIFEIDNKLDPDRKLKVAGDLGLQPRQVAIWFQNRRARWKTKQLERDYNLLKSNYDFLKHNYHKLEQEKETLTKELVEVKAKLHYETSEDNNNTNHEKALKFLDLKDRFYDSDSSGVLNDDNMNVSTENGSQSLNMTSFGVSSLCSSSAVIDPGTYQQHSDPYLVSNAEDESCNFFLVDQAPNLCWY